MSSSHPAHSSQPRSADESLRRIAEGDSEAREDLYAILLQHLRTIVRSELRGNPLSPVLRPSDVVQQACVRMGVDRLKVSPRDDRELYIAATRAVRWVVLDHARRDKSKRETTPGDAVLEQSLQNFETAAGTSLDALSDALDELRRNHHRVAEVVEGKFFGDLTHAELAERLQMSVGTVKRDWQFGRAFLHDYLRRRNAI
ncbi:MAG: ECF-type sigma factor [Planctomycetota bacterium]